MFMIFKKISSDEEKYKKIEEEIKEIDNPVNSITPTTQNTDIKQ